MVAVLFLGCSSLKKKRDINDEISKDGAVAIESIYDIILKNYGFDTRNLQNILKYKLHYDGQDTQEELEKNYRLSFYFTHDSRDFDPYETNSIFGMVLMPCNSTLDYDDVTKYPIHFTFDDSVEKIEFPKKYGVFFKIEDLKKVDYISEKPEKQKDLCLFEKWKSGGMGNDDYFSSNKLVYSAEEINNALAEYEVLQ